MSYLPRGNFATFDWNNPQPWAYCDRSGFRGNRKDMVQQMEFNAEGLYWIGFWVQKNFLRQPNPQNLAPRIMGDPYPVEIPLPKRFLPED